MQGDLLGKIDATYREQLQKEATKTQFTDNMAILERLFNDFNSKLDATIDVACQEIPLPTQKPTVNSSVQEIYNSTMIDCFESLSEYCKTDDPGHIKPPKISMLSDNCVQQ